ncbi:hypothetical protein V8E36_003417 [Tilletia maclaganii]
MASFHIPGASTPTAGSSKDQRSTSQDERTGTGAMMFLGQQCHWHECHREDFLPFKCSDCTHPFCAEHFRPQQHACAAAAARDAAEDFRVPLCPICNEPPKNWRRGEDPNIAMERHLSSGQCAALTSDGLLRDSAKAKQPGGSVGVAAAASAPRVKKTNECNFTRCHKIMMVPIRCSDCGADFCPSHRAPAQHTCRSLEAKNRASAAASSSAAPASSKSSAAAAGGGANIRAAREAFLKKLSDSKPSIPKSKASATGAPSQAQQLTSKSTPPNTTALVESSAAKSTSSSSGNTSSSSSGGLFKTKAERRSEAEKASALRALHARHAKGLKLTAEEEQRLAEGMAGMRLRGLKAFGNAGGTGGKDAEGDDKCTIC